MSPAQTQYLIVANRNCATHPRGTRLVYTGPRSGVPRGWSVIGRCWQDDMLNRGGVV